MIERESIEDGSNTIAIGELGRDIGINSQGNLPDFEGQTGPTVRGFSGGYRSGDDGIVDGGDQLLLDGELSYLNNQSNINLFWSGFVITPCQQIKID